MKASRPSWSPVEGTVEQILEQWPSPVHSLTSGEVPAFIVRNVYRADAAAELVSRCFADGRLYEPPASSTGKRQ